MRTLLRTQPILIALTLLNLGSLGILVFRALPVALTTPTADGVLRGRGLEITDDQGRVRASIAIGPAVKQTDGSTYPETVLLRLITSEGRPIVKISSSEDGAGMALSAAEGPSYVQILSRGNAPKVLLVDDAGRQISALP